MSSISGRGVAGPSSGGRVPTKITEFLSSGTWTKHPLTKWMEVFCYPGGNGGAQGFQCPAGQVASGSSGPGGGSVGYFNGPAIDVPDSVAITVGAAGLGGDDGTPTGTLGGISQFGDVTVVATNGGYPGGLGEVGSVGAATSGGFGADVINFGPDTYFSPKLNTNRVPFTQFGGGVGGGGAVDGTNDGLGTPGQWGGGGAGNGGGITAGGTANAGSYGGSFSFGGYNPGDGGEPGQPGSDGIPGTGTAMGGSGCGGGAGVGEPGGDGGAGGFPGGCGGSGGNGYDTSLPGNGGDGGAGMVRIVEYF